MRLHGEELVDTLPSILLTGNGFQNGPKNSVCGEYCLFYCYDKYLTKGTPRRTGLFGLVFEGTGHHDREGMAAGPPGIQSQEVEGGMLAFTFSFLVPLGC